MNRERIHTSDAPKAIGSYSQAIRTGETVYLSGQVPLDPASMKVVEGPIERQIERVFENLKAVAEAAGGSLANIAKLTVYLTDLSHFSHVNEVMARYFKEPYPARAAIGVAALPLGVPVEIDAILVLDASQQHTQ
jgi:reactive intermediate/imine deaminase